MTTPDEAEDLRALIAKLKQIEASNPELVRADPELVRAAKRWDRWDKFEQKYYPKPDQQPQQTDPPMDLFKAADQLLGRIALRIQEDPEAEKHYTPTLVRLAKQRAASNPEPVQADPVKQTAEKVVEVVNDPKQPIKVRQINIRVTAEQGQLLKQYCVRNGVTTQQAVIQALQGLIEGFPQQ